MKIVDYLVCHQKELRGKFYRNRLIDTFSSSSWHGNISRKTRSENGPLGPKSQISKRQTKLNIMKCW